MFLLKRIKIIVVADCGSIHTALFVGLLQSLRYRLKIFKFSFSYYQNELLKKATIDVIFPYCEPTHGNVLEGFGEVKQKLASLIQNNFWVYTRFCRLANRIKISPRWRAKKLVKLVEDYKPDVIISLKTQNNGYVTAEAKKMFKGSFPAWIHFSWGSDFEFFGKNKAFSAKHLPKIREVLAGCDYFLADSRRDVEQAKRLGFTGDNLGMMLATGGYNLKEFARLKKKKLPRNIILIKGRQDEFGGKALNILKALKKIAPKLQNYKIKIIYYNLELKTVVEALSSKTNLDIELVGWIPYKKIVELFLQSRVTISASEIEGTPSFLLESMVTGAFPIHSDLPTIRDWVTDGQNGFLFQPNDIEDLSRKILIALNDQTLTEKAEKINWKIAEERMDRQKIKKQVKELIEEKIIHAKKIS